MANNYKNVETQYLAYQNINDELLMEQATPERESPPRTQLLRRALSTQSKGINH